MIKKITSFTHHTTAEGERVTYTFSIINEEGQLVKSNERATMILLDQEMLESVKKINEYLAQRIPE